MGHAPASSQGQSVRNDTKYTYFDNGWTNSSTDVNNTATQGNWDASQAVGQWGYDVRTHAKGSGSSQFVWQLNIPQDGSYEVFVRHGDVTGAASDASFKVTHATGDVTRTVDQSKRSGEWISLGSYSFTEAAAQKIALTDAANVVRVRPAGPDHQLRSRSELMVARRYVSSDRRRSCRLLRAGKCSGSRGGFAPNHFGMAVGGNRPLLEFSMGWHILLPRRQCSPGMGSISGGTDTVRAPCGRCLYGIHPADEALRRALRGV
ncbi:golvesin C-terminal-like domain-containing protein [Streptomyces niveus]